MDELIIKSKEMLNEHLDESGADKVSAIIDEGMKDGKYYQVRLTVAYSSDDFD